MLALGCPGTIEKRMGQDGFHAGARGLDFFGGCAQDASVELRPLADGSAVGVEWHVAQDGVDECTEASACGTGLKAGRYREASRHQFHGDGIWWGVGCLARKEHCELWARCSGDGCGAFLLPSTISSVTRT